MIKEHICLLEDSSKLVHLSTGTPWINSVVNTSLADSSSRFKS